VINFIGTKLFFILTTFPFSLKSKLQVFHNKQRQLINWNIHFIDLDRLHFSSSLKTDNKSLIRRHPENDSQFSKQL